MLRSDPETDSLFHLQDYFPGAALLPVCQKRSVPSASLQSQERLDLIQATSLQNVPCRYKSSRESVQSHHRTYFSFSLSPAQTGLAAIPFLLFFSVNILLSLSLNEDVSHPPPHQHQLCSHLSRTLFSPSHLTLHGRLRGFAGYCASV